MNRLDKVFIYLITIFLAAFIRHNGDPMITIAMGVLVVAIAWNIFGTKDK